MGRAPPLLALPHTRTRSSSQCPRSATAPKQSDSLLAQLAGHPLLQQPTNGGAQRRADGKQRVHLCVWGGAGCVGGWGVIVWAWVWAWAGVEGASKRLRRQGARRAAGGSGQRALPSPPPIKTQKGRKVKEARLLVLLDDLVVGSTPGLVGFDPGGGGGGGCAGGCGRARGGWSGGQGWRGRAGARPPHRSYPPRATTTTAHEAPKQKGSPARSLGNVGEDKVEALGGINVPLRMGGGRGGGRGGVGGRAGGRAGKRAGGQAGMRVGGWAGKGSSGRARARARRVLLRPAPPHPPYHPPPHPYHPPSHPPNPPHTGASRGRKGGAALTCSMR